jgi:hypothetical protein
MYFVIPVKRTFKIKNNYLAFQAFGFERTWWWLFYRRNVRIKLDIYLFINIPWSISLLVDY